MESDPQYDNTEERRDIENVENVVANDLGEPVRDDHAAQSLQYESDSTAHDLNVRETPVDSELQGIAGDIAGDNPSDDSGSYWGDSYWADDDSSGGDYQELFVDSSYYA